MSIGAVLSELGGQEGEVSQYRDPIFAATGTPLTSTNSVALGEANHGDLYVMPLNNLFILL